MTAPTPATLEIFKHLFASVAEEMGVTLGRTGHSPNIKERLDYSCALFMGDGRLLAQAAHIPVHLGAMPASVASAIAHCSPTAPGDVIILNDPFLGGTHLPDITLVSPVFVAAPDAPAPTFFVASRAHHADIGGISPGSMPLSTEIFQEGLILPPVKLVAGGERNDPLWQTILRNSRTPDERRGDLAAQLAAHEIGARRALEIVRRYGLEAVQAHAAALIAYADRLARAAIDAIPDGRYIFEDHLEAPAAGFGPLEAGGIPGRSPGPNVHTEGGEGSLIPIRVTLIVRGSSLTADFSGTAPAVPGNLNAGRAIVESALAYALRLIAGSDLPMNAGAFAPLTAVLPAGSLLDARPPRAVAAGNVETSQRIVDVLLGAFALALPDRIPAASQGTMNNLTFGATDPRTGQSFAYYETMGGGAGAGPGTDGASGVHVHMSNTRNTPVEALEIALPVVVERYALRRGSGGDGARRGGDGLRRDIRFLVPVRMAVLSDRRLKPPWGLRGGGPGARGRNVVVREGREFELPGKASLDLAAGEVLSIRSPGGGGWGAPG